MPTRISPGQRSADVKSKIRSDMQIAAANREEHAKAEPTKPKAPATPAPGIVRQSIDGEGRDAPLYSDPVAVPPWAEFIAFRIERQSGPGAVVLQASNNLDAEVWAIAPYNRPPAPQPWMASARTVEGSYTKPEAKTAYNGPLAPRFPQWVRVAALVSMNADTVIEFREGA